MKTLNIFLSLVGLTFLVACSASSKITYDYDDTVNFNNYKTFVLGQQTSLNLKALDSVRFVKALAKALTEKGINSTLRASLIISIKRTQKEAESRTQIGVGIGQQTRHTGINIGGAIPIPRHATTQTLTIDFRDAKTRKLIWQSHTSHTFKNNLQPLEKEQMFYNLFVDVLKGYPPKN